jgi:hypothetical protein
MNKRIRELATFCIDNSYEMRINIEDFERFAELIIKDCVQMFADEGYDESVDMLIDHWDIDPRKLRN